MSTSELAGWLCELSGRSGRELGEEDGERIWVVTAHPDDETLGASWLLARAGAAEVIHVTDGAPRDERLWPASVRERGAGERSEYAALRRAESELALSHVGLTRDHIHELGFVDQEAALSIAAIARALADRFEQGRPAVVVTHPYEAGHPDHDATAWSVRAAVALLARRGLSPPLLLEMTSYHAHEGALRTGAFLPHLGQESARALCGRDADLKRAMLACYASQREVLSMFRVDEERYRRAAPLDLERTPHEGPLACELLGFSLTFEHFGRLVREALAELELPSMLPP